MSKESKDLRAKRAKLIEDARALVAASDAGPEADAKFDAMMAEADGLKARIDRIEQADEAQQQTFEALHARARRDGTSTDEAHEQTELERSTFATWMRHGSGPLNDEQRRVFNARFQNALGTTPDTAGGYTVPQGFYTQLIDAQLAYGGMLDVSYVFDTASGNVLPIPTDNDTSNKGAILGENVQVSTQDVSFGAVTMNAYTYSSKLVLVSNQLLQDSVFNLDAFLSAKLGTRIARIANDHFTTGTGASQPTGIVTAATLGTTAGSTQTVTTGWTTSVTFDDLIDLEHSVDPAYRVGAKFMFHDLTLKSLKKLKDSLGRPLWMPGLQTKEPDTINSYPYVVNQSMPIMAASAKSIAFGDFKNYFIRRVAGVQILRLTERYADFNQVGFLAFQRWDGQLIDAGTHPVKYLQNSAT